MIPVLQSIHSKTNPHTGGASLLKIENGAYRGLFDDGKLIVNTYDYSGNKLSEEVWMNRESQRLTMVFDSTTMVFDSLWVDDPRYGYRRDYIGNVELEEGVWQVVHHAEGRVVNQEAPALYYMGDTIWADEPHATDHYYYAHDIYSESVIIGPGNVIFEAKNSIKMEYPFDVLENTGIDFEARLGQGSVDTGLVWEYDIKDHLGNIRLSFADLNGDGNITVSGDVDNEILEEHHYYPFGAKHTGPWLQRKNLGFKNRYGFGSKEEIPFSGYRDFIARTYDPWLGRMLQIDPLADDFIGITTFGYAANNPLRFIDPDGRSVTDPEAFAAVGAFSGSHFGSSSLTDFEGQAKVDAMLNKAEQKAKIQKLIEDGEKVRQGREEGGVDDDYGIDKSGRITLLRKTDDPTDRIFAVDKSGSVDDDNYITVDKSITEGLQNNKTVTVGENLQDDVFETFMFGATNTDVEWSAMRGIDSDGNNVFGVGTNNEPERGPGAGKFGVPWKNVISHIHSHPSPNDGFSGEPNTMYGDRGVAQWYRDRNNGKIPFNFYVYMADSGRIWSINKSKDRIEYIRNAKQNHKRLYFGTLNSR